MISRAASSAVTILPFAMPMFVVPDEPGTLAPRRHSSSIQPDPPPDLDIPRSRGAPNLVGRRPNEEPLTGPMHRCTITRYEKAVRRRSRPVTHKPYPVA